MVKLKIWDSIFACTKNLLVFWSNNKEYNYWKRISWIETLFKKKKKKTIELAFVYLIEKVFRHKKIWHIPMWQIINVRKKLTSIVSPNKNQYKLIILVFIVNIVNFYFDVTLFNFQQWTFRENCWLKSSVKVKQPKTNKALQPNRPHWLLHWLAPKLSYVSLN